MGINGPLFYFLLPAFLAMIAIEYWVGRKRGLRLYSRGETLASLGVQIGQRVIGLFTFGIVGVAWTFAYQHRLFDFEMTLAAGVLLFVLLEFTYYWFHRLSHEVRWFWTTHAVHHSIEEMNILGSYRLGWTSKITAASLTHTPAMLIGFSPVEVATLLAFNLFYQSWLHTVLIGKLGPLEGVLNTPSAHRVHHARNGAYLDMNYGGVTVIFDRLFGTYVPEDDDVPCKYGLVKPVGSTNPITIAFHETVRLYDDLRRSHPKHWPGFIFGAPGWAPDGKGETSAVLRARFKTQRAQERSKDGAFGESANILPGE
jgi:sterol desaturase/sphingolipid hydroxylase (fatty acid hydroxylase superfamily)